MNPDNRKLALEEFVRRAYEKLGNKIERIILFGSYARGEAGPESDIDVLVIGEVSLEEIMDISYPVLLEYGVFISPKVMTSGHYNRLDKERYGFIRNVKLEGRPLYA